MAFYEWTETMSVGVDLFDSDHKALIGLINRLHESLEGDEPAPLGEIFDTLIAYAELHFAREEKGFRERYPGGSDPARTGELLDYLKLWLNHHILIQDMAYKPYAAGDREVERVARSFGPGLADSGGRAGPFESKHAAPTAEPG
jgi:hemerythrin